MEAQYADECPKCGMKRKDMLEKGIFGCSYCFEVFAWDARTILREVQGIAKYDGNDSEYSENEIVSKSIEVGDLYDREYEGMFGKNVCCDSDEVIEEEKEPNSENVVSTDNESTEIDSKEPETESPKEQETEQKTEAVTSFAKEYIDLSNEIEEAVKAEDYELAAKLRDKLRSLRNKNNQEEEQ